MTSLSFIPTAAQAEKLELFISTIRRRASCEQSIRLAEANGRKGRELTPLKRELRQAKRLSQDLAVELHAEGMPRPTIREALRVGLGSAEA